MNDEFERDKILVTFIGAVILAMIAVAMWMIKM